jgi:ribosome recycling factor
MSDVGLVPNNDGNVIRLNIPPLTEERRKEFVKMAAKLAEEGKVSIRNIRRDTIETIRKQQKASEISEDDSKDMQDKIQKLTDSYSKEIDRVLAEKTKEITTV